NLWLLFSYWRLSAVEKAHGSVSQTQDGMEVSFPVGLHPGEGHFRAGEWDTFIFPHTWRVLILDPVVAMERNAFHVEFTHTVSSHKVHSGRQSLSCVVLSVPLRDESIESDGEILVGCLTGEDPKQLSLSRINACAYRAFERRRQKGDLHTGRRSVLCERDSEQRDQSEKRLMHTGRNTGSGTDYPATRNFRGTP